MLVTTYLFEGCLVMPGQDIPWRVGQMVQFERKVLYPQIKVMLVMAKARFQGLNGEGKDQVGR